MKICYDQGYDDIGVVIAMKWRHFQLYLPLGTDLSKSFTAALSS